jgi:cytochrome c-type biogenesis protein CcmH/NrfF
MIGSIKEKTGCSQDYILWGQPWVIFLMEAADAAKYRRGRRRAPVVESAEDIEKILGKRIKRIKLDEP